MSGACDPDQFACEITQADASHCYDSSQLCDGRIDCNKNQADESNPLCQSNCNDQFPIELSQFYMIYAVQIKSVQLVCIRVC